MVTFTSGVQNKDKNKNKETLHFHEIHERSLWVLGLLLAGLVREVTVLELASLAGMPLPPGVGGMQGVEGGRV